MPEEPKPSAPLINIKDLAGLSEPMIKLIETVRAGCGQVADGVAKLVNTYALSKAEANNEAYRISTIGDAETRLLVNRAQAISALSNEKQSIQHIEIASEGVQAKLTGNSPEVAALLTRSDNRLAYQNALHQINIEAVVTQAAIALEEGGEVTTEPVNQRWTNQFFRIVEDMSDEDLQALWGRILAGEIKNPGSYSPRTLSFLATLTQQEAKDFQGVCACVWLFDEATLEAVIPYIDQTDTFKTSIDYYIVQHLSDIGLLDFTLEGSDYVYENNPVMASYNGKNFTISNPKTKINEIDIGHVNLTRLGREIASICKPVYDFYIMQEAIDYWRGIGYEVSEVSSSS